MTHDMRKVMTEIAAETGDTATKNGQLVGISSIDMSLMGFMRKSVYLLGSRPGMGKTALALNIVRNYAVKLGLPVGLISLELSAHQLAVRLLCIESGIDSNLLRTGKLSKEDSVKFNDASKIFSESQIIIDDDPNQTITDIVASATNLKQKYAIELLVIDYLQLIKTSGNQLVTKSNIEEICQGFRPLARVLDIPILILTQLSVTVEERKDKIPQLIDIRHTEAVEENVDVIMFLHRLGLYFPDEFDLSETRLIVAKNNNGPTGVIKLRFDSNSQIFESAQ